MNDYYDVLIIGSGIAASSCIGELFDLSDGRLSILMISNCPNIKLPVSLNSFTKVLDEINVTELSARHYFDKKNNFAFILDLVTAVDDLKKIAFTRSNLKINYGKLIICAGAYPVNPFKDTPLVYTLRDVDSVKHFSKILSHSKRICIVGNGGIALELAFEINDCEIYWVLRQNYLGGRFFDEETSQFFTTMMESRRNVDETSSSSYLRKYEQRPYIKQGLDSTNAPLSLLYNDVSGGAVGPDWSRNIKLSGSKVNSAFPNNITYFYNCEATNIVYSKGDVENVTVHLSNGDSFICDCVVVATGVIANSMITLSTGNKFAQSTSGAYIVSKYMQTSVPDIYAAGDCCSLIVNDSSTPTDQPRLWFQLNTWAQAKHMGMYAAQCLMQESPIFPIQLELFGHVTRFFGLKVCLLGLYNAQSMNIKDLTFYKRSLNPNEFIRIVVYKGKIIGAIMIGDTDFEETVENLILSKLDISDIGEYILSPDIDIADYFD